MRIWVTAVGSLPGNSSEQKKHGLKAELEEEDRMDQVDLSCQAHSVTLARLPDRPWSPRLVAHLVTAALPSPRVQLLVEWGLKVL